MNRTNTLGRSTALLLATTTLGAGCAAGGGAVGNAIPAEEQQDPDTIPADDAPPEFVAVNDGGAKIEERLGDSTFSGQAAGALESGTLVLTFAADGVLDTLGGSLLGAYFGFPAGSEVIFDYRTQTVTGTYADTGGGARALEDFLTQAGQYIHLAKIVVVLVGDSFTVRTEYQTNVPGLSGGTQAIDFGATLRFPGDDTLQGALGLPNRTTDQDPLFTLERQ